MGDIRYALRNLLRRPTFTLIAVVTLALGIGANTAIFSAINALLLKPLPFPELDRVVAVWDKLPSRGVMHNEVTVANYLDWQSQTQSFDQLALYPLVERKSHRHRSARTHPGISRHCKLSRRHRHKADHGPQLLA